MIMFFVPTTKTDLVYVQYDVQLKLTYIGSNLVGGMKGTNRKGRKCPPISHGEMDIHIRKKIIMNYLTWWTWIFT